MSELAELSCGLWPTTTNTTLATAAITAMICIQTNAQVHLIVVHAIQWQQRQHNASHLCCNARWLHLIAMDCFRLMHTTRV